MPVDADIDALASAITSRVFPRDPFQQLVISYTVLGRVSSHVHIPTRPKDSEKYKCEYKGLQRLIEYIGCCTSFPSENPQIDTSAKEFTSTWLQMIVHAASMLLHCQPADHPAGEKRGMAVWTAAGADGDHTQAAKCQIAMMAVVDLLRSALLSGTGSEAIANPHISSGIFLCAHLLMIQWHETASPATRANIDVMLSAFEVLGQRFPVLGRKFTYGVRFGLDSSMCPILNSPGLRGMLIFCNSWSKGSLPQNLRCE